MGEVLRCLFVFAVEKGFFFHFLVLVLRRGSGGGPLRLMLRVTDVLTSMVYPR